MFGNLFSKPTPPGIPVEPLLPSLKQEDYDDWKLTQGDWTKAHICHCGHRRDNPERDLCPNCGCIDPFQPKVVREEYEISQKLRSAYWRSTVAPIYGLLHPVYTRNWKTVEWKECSHE